MAIFKYKTTLVGCWENISSMKVGFFKSFFITVVL